VFEFVEAWKEADGGIRWKECFASFATRHAGKQPYTVMRNFRQAYYAECKRREQRGTPTTFTATELAGDLGYDRPCLSQTVERLLGGDYRFESRARGCRRAAPTDGRLCRPPAGRLTYAASA
jgi:hypothetical protein